MQGILEGAIFYNRPLYISFFSPLGYGYFALCLFIGYEYMLLFNFVFGLTFSFFCFWVC